MAAQVGAVLSGEPKPSLDSPPWAMISLDMRLGFSGTDGISPNERRVHTSITECSRVTSVPLLTVDRGLFAIATAGACDRSSFGFRGTRPGSRRSGS